MAISRYTQIMIIDTQANLPASGQTGDFAYCLDAQVTFIWNGTSWQATAKVGVKKSNVTVTATATGSVAVYTLEPSSLSFFPSQIVPRVVSISGVTLAPTISVGTNATSYNNIATGGLLPTALSGLGIGNGVPQVTSYSPALAGGSVIYANVTGAAAATTYQIKYDILGFYDVS